MIALSIALHSGVFTSASDLAAQTVPQLEPALVVAPPEPLAEVPFGPGERLEYQLKLGVFSVGEGHLEVEAIDTVRGRETYRLSMGFQGGWLFAKVDDHYQSQLDTRTLSSRHFIRDVHEVNYKSFREWAIYPEERYWERLDADISEQMSSSQPLDELAFMFWLRTLPLEVGETYTYSRYFKDQGNPVILKVLRKELREVPAGEFNTIVVQPIIRTNGLFSQGGKAEIYLSDDAHRHIVYLRSEIPLVGSITLHLREIRHGTLLAPAVDEEAVGPDAAAGESGADGVAGVGAIGSPSVGR